MQGLPGLRWSCHHAKRIMLPHDVPHAKLEPSQTAVKDIIGMTKAGILRRAARAHLSSSLEERPSRMEACPYVTKRIKGFMA